jgi:hypothetical protein
MLAPPARRKRKPPEARRADNRRRQRECRMRQENGLHRCTMWISGAAYEGLIRQLVRTGKLNSDDTDHRRFEAALTLLIEQQGRSWSV